MSQLSDAGVDVGEESKRAAMSQLSDAGVDVGEESKRAAMSQLSDAGISIPGATEDEAAAILAAYEALWPKPAPLVTAPPATSAWRFSGRWWNKNHLRR